MKKIGLILITFLLITFGLSADAVDSTSLHMVTSVAEMSQVVVGNHGASLPTTKSSFESAGPIATEEDPFVFGWNEGDFYSEHYFAAFVMTNVPGNYSVGATAEPLTTGQQNGYALPYSVDIGGTVTKITDSSASLTLINNFSVLASDGLSFDKSGTVTLTVNLSDYEAAGSGNYSSTWTIELIKD